MPSLRKEDSARTPVPGISNLVPAPPWSSNQASDPGIGVDRSLHPSASPLDVTGSETILTILINFNDTTNSSTHTPAFFDDLMYNASASSLNKYFQDNSYNLFCVTGNTTSKFYTASYSEAYYGTYEFSYVSGYGNTLDLALEALKAADADIDFSNYDKNGDGYVDHVLIVHAGKDDANDGDATGPGGDPQMWSHAIHGASFGQKFDGKYVTDYTMLSEDDPVGVFVHEFGHDLGLPDLYDTDYSSDGGCGAWEVMASGSWNNGGKTPSQLGAWCKHELGWLTPTLVSVDTQGINAKRIEDNQTAFKIWANISNSEYFLIENREQTGWDASLPGSGLLIWHINETATSNDKDAFRLVDLEEWDNSNYASNANDAWKSNATGMTPSTTPGTNDYSGKKTDLRIYNISASGNLMYFDVDVGNSPPGAPTPTAPADGAWTMSSKPTVNWSFSDPDAGDTQGAYEAQFDDSSGFTSVNWDSGEVAGSGSSCTVAAALSEGKWYWRVRTKDSVGAWGPYNSPARVVNIDLTAPAAPAAFAATPSGWTASNSFSIDWNYPSESGTSGIAPGAYYKLDSAPASATDGTWSASKPVSGISVGGQGSHVVYIWLKDNAGNVNEANRASTTVYYDYQGPGGPYDVDSPTHAKNLWSNATVIKVTWNKADDNFSGLDGYSFVWDNVPATEPDHVKDGNESLVADSTVALPDGTYYFHIIPVDKAGNWGTTRHAGPYSIDTSPPTGVTSVTSTSHQLGRWSSLKEVDLAWTGATDAGSGVKGYSWVMDHSIDTIPDDNIEEFAGGDQANIILPDGRGYYFHIRVADACYNWNPTAFHFGPFLIDTVAPANPTDYLVLSGQEVGRWTADRLIQLLWAGQSDSASGVEGFSVSWDKDPEGGTDFTEDLVGQGYSELADASGENYIHIRTKDVAGNWNTEVFTVGPFLVDHTRPTDVTARPPYNLTNSTTIEWTWWHAVDLESGVAGYKVCIYTDIRNEEYELYETAGASFTLYNARDGMTYYILVQAFDGVGNIGSGALLGEGVLVDLSPPHGLGITIDGGKAVTTENRVALSLSAQDDVSGVSEMRFSLDGIDWTPYVPYNDEYSLELPSGDGPKQIYFQVHDLAGNEARPVAAGIVLDTAGPLVESLEVIGGLATNGTTVFVRVSARDALSGVARVRLGADGSSWGPWQPYGDAIAWELTGADGPKEIFAQAMDGAGNVGKAGEQRATVVLDRTPPGKPVVTSSTHSSREIWYNLSTMELGWTIPDDATGIAGYAYIITADATDEPGYRVQLGGTSIRTDVPGEGVWHFRIRARDGAGNWGEAADIKIRADTRGPTVPKPTQPPEGWEFLPESQVPLAWEPAADALSGVKGYYVQVFAGEGMSSVVFEGLVDGTGYTVQPLPEGNYLWQVRARDAAGNWGGYGPVSSFCVRKPVKVTETPEQPGFLSLSNPLFLIVLVVLMVAMAGGAVAAARRRRKEPPAAETTESQPVQWG